MPNEAAPAQVLAPTALPPAGTFTLVPRTLEEAMHFAKLISQSDLVPKDYREKPANCLVAMQWGMELGLHPLQAIQNIAVINGRPSMWGDAMLALVRASPLCEYVHETYLTDGTAEIRTKRRGDPKEHVGTFSDEDAKTAQLLGKEGSWRTNPKRMKRMRARAFMLRDVYTDVLRGIAMAEELMDFPPEKDVTPARPEPQMPREKSTEPTAAEGAQHIDAASPEAKAEPEAKAVEGEHIPAADVKKDPRAAGPATASMITMIRKKAEQATITVEELGKRLGRTRPADMSEDAEWDPLAGITISEGNALLEFIRNPSGK